LESSANFPITQLGQELLNLLKKVEVLNANRISKGKKNVHKVPLYLAGLNQSLYDQKNKQLNAAAEANAR